jgi:hypothetical protein
VEQKLNDVCAAAEWREPTSPELNAAVHHITPVVREALQQLVATRWAVSSDSAESSRLLGRLRNLSHQAIARRDHRLLRLLERAMTFAAGGHTAGEAELIARLAGAGDRDLLAALPALPEPTIGWDSVEPRLTGLVLITSFP